MAASLAEQGFELVEFGIVAVLALKPRGAFKLLDHWVECAVHVIGRAEIAESSVRLGAQSLMQRGDQTRLADTRLARQSHDLTLSRPTLLPTWTEQFDL